MFLKFAKILGLTILLASLLPACSSGKSHPLTMMPLNQMPDNIQSAPVSVQQAYQYASANPNVMKQIPCYCGCVSVGHISNYSCYVQGENSDGILTFDTHALGCSICVDITQDVMRLQREGKSIQEIKSYVDTTYSKYGSSNMP